MGGVNKGVWPICLIPLSEITGKTNPNWLFFSTVRQSSSTYSSSLNEGTEGDTFPRVPTKIMRLTYIDEESFIGEDVLREEKTSLTKEKNRETTIIWNQCLSRKYREEWDNYGNIYQWYINRTHNSIERHLIEVTR